jgi:hypothetical protein
MLFNVPQFIEIEDKIVGPLTAKQLGWLAAGGVLLLILWATLDGQAFIVSALIVVPIFGAFAFYRPNNQPLLNFIISGASYLMRPKEYMWKRNYDSVKSVSGISKKQKTNLNSQPQRKTLDSKKLVDLSKILDENQ